VAALVSEAATAPLLRAQTEQLQRLLVCARQDGTPLVLCLERMCLEDDPAHVGLLAVRRLLAAAIRAQEQGVPMLIFAGAGGDLVSTLLTWSGGRRIEIAAGEGAASCRIDWLREQSSDFLRAEVAVPAFEDRHRSLLHRLRTAGVELPRTVRPNDALPGLAAQFDAGFDSLVGPGILRGVRVRGGREITLTGLVAGALMNPVAAWMLAESIITSIKARPERPIVLVLDSAGDADATVDESSLLSEYLAHLAQTVSWARSQMVALNAWIVGGAGAASFVACTAAAARVVAFSEAKLGLGPHSLAGGAHGAVTAALSRTAWRVPELVDEVIDEGGSIVRVELALSVAA
jgi:hypothetical protein